MTGADVTGLPVRVAMLVDNGVFGDSRVLKSARTAQDAGFEVAVLGLGRTPQNLTISGVPVMLRPGLDLKPEPRRSAKLATALAPSRQVRRRRALTSARVGRARRAAAASTGAKRLVLLGKTAVAWSIDAPGRSLMAVRLGIVSSAAARGAKPRPTGPPRAAWSRVMGNRSSRRVRMSYDPARGVGSGHGAREPAP